MANLKLDLLNKLGNDKYYEEIELVRLAQDPDTNYKNKIDDMVLSLKNLAILNAQIGLIEQYFKEPVQPEQINNSQTPVGQTQVHQGQTHGE